MSNKEDRTTMLLVRLKIFTKYLFSFETIFLLAYKLSVSFGIKLRIMHSITVNETIKTNVDFNFRPKFLALISLDKKIMSYINKLKTIFIDFIYLSSFNFFSTSFMIKEQSFSNLLRVF
jgi:hypothetical protein